MIFHDLSSRSLMDMSGGAASWQGWLQHQFWGLLIDVHRQWVLSQQMLA